MASYDDTATVSGSVVSFSDGADDVPMKSVIAHIAPTLTGTNAVNMVQTGKNLFDGYTKGYGVNSSTGEIFTNNNGAISGYIPIKPNTAFYVSCLTATIHSFVAYYKADKTYISRTNGSNRTYVSATTPNECYFLIVYQYANNDTGTIDDVDNLQTQLEFGSSASSYEPYTAPTTYTANLGRTVYGADVDLVSGQGTDGARKETMTSTYLNGLAEGYIGYTASVSAFGGHSAIWVRNFGYPYANQIVSGGIGCVCNHFPVTMNNQSVVSSQYRIYFDVDGKNISSASDFIDYVSTLEQNNDSLDIVYELATGTDFTFDGQEIPSLLGVNTLWSDQGNTELTYYKDGYGFTSVTIHKETPDGEPVEQTAKLHRIVYEGQVDVVAGKGTTNYKNFKLYDLTWSGGVIGGQMWCWYVDLSTEGLKLPANSEIFDGLCDSYTPIRYNAISTNANTIALRNNGYLYVNNGSDTVKPTGNVLITLATPSEFTFPPISMETDEGENTLYADEGDSAITYRKAVD